MDLIGKILGGRYEIIEKIGTGGMAIVYKAKCHMLNRFVAIKVLRQEFINDPEIVNKFSVESQAAASLTHPNIVSIYDVGKEGDINYIVMEYVEGETLKEYIRKHGALQWTDAAGFSLQIASALEAAHKNNIVHRDIKSHNIMVTKEGTVKVTDFGIARAATSSTLVAGGATIGSVHYMSPEQARGGYVDEKSDIYSLGVVIYEMLTGRVPFDADLPVSVALMHIDQEPQPITELNPSVPHRFEEIVSKLMSKEQINRYQNVTSLIQDLRELINSNDEDKNISIVLVDKNTNGKSTRTAKKKQKKERKKEDSNAVIAAVITSLFIVIIGAFVAYGLIVGWSVPEVSVPSLENMTQEQAKEALKQVKLKIRVNQDGEYSDEVEKGYVLSQEPKANDIVKAKTYVNVVLSNGKKEVTVPDVVNKAIRNAELEIKNAELECVTIDQESETVPEGVVISQTPSSGATVQAGSQVQVYVSKKKQLDTVKVPDVEGMTLSQAKRELESKKLKVGETVRQDSDQPLDTVIRQAPSAGDETEENTAVTLVLSNGKHSSTATATPSPSNRPTASPTSAPVTKNKNLTFNLPQDDREYVQVRITANGREIYNKRHATKERFFEIVVSGSKESEIKVYYDNQLVNTKTITFD